MRILQLGKSFPVTDGVEKLMVSLVEGLSARDAGCVCGKTSRGHMVNFPGNTELTGRMVPVRIASAGRNTLRGSLAE